MPTVLRVERWLESAWAPRFVGQVAVLRRRELRHRDDLSAKAAALQTLPGLAALREVVKVDRGGAFRPLRGAPDLQRGWRLKLPDAAALVEALNVIYPAAAAFWTAREEGKLAVTPLAATLARQTGMYRLVQTASLRQAVETVAAVCAGGCLRQRLWQPLSRTDAPPDEMPLYCPEACNFFVARLRERVARDRESAAPREC